MKISDEIASRLSPGFLVGLDASAKMIDFASLNFHSSEYRNLLFMRGDALQLPFRGQFDLVVSFCTLHWVLDQAKALAGISQSLVAGGRALLVIPAAAPNNLSTQCEQLVK